MKSEIIEYNPDINSHLKKKLLKYSRDILLLTSDLGDSERENKLILLREQLHNDYSGNIFLNNVELVFFKSLLLDLLIQDWKIIIRHNRILLEYTQINKNDVEYDSKKEKAKTRRKHLLNRNIQLKEPSVCAFIKKMERVHLNKRGWNSIFSLMRDGSELEKEIRKIVILQKDEDKIKELNSLIKPYLQFVEPKLRCDHTGILLSDIWRYFRHTWVKEYKSLPGRSISILIRDAGAKNHPIIGIAALGSSIAQQTCRDEWIGWDGKTFYENIKNNPSGKYSRWILKALNKLFKQIYLEDLIKSKIINRNEIRKPTEEKINVLRKHSIIFKQKHLQSPYKSRFTSENSELTWKDRARSNLFTSKRILFLSDLLYIRFVLNKYGFTKGTKKELMRCIDKKDFKDIVERIVRKIKSIHLGIDMMDIIVCGAIAPYNHLLGGKLVSMMLTSPEIVKYYKNKYSNSHSLIASSMKGKSVLRETNLVLLCTTSLYHVGSSQYNRITIPLCNKDKQNERKIEYKKIGLSEGYGSFHFSSQTIKLAEIIIGRKNGKRRVNSIFGEGANPLVRKIKDALNLFKLTANPILNHRSPRVVYGIRLADNFREILTEFSNKPKYLFRQSNPKFQTDFIIKYWIKRWLNKRIKNEEILDKINSETLTYPIQHGGRVQLPNNSNEELTLF